MASLVIRGGEVFDGESTASADVLVDGERVLAIAPVAPVATDTSARTLDAGGCLVVPGFIDLQCNGAFGIDFTNEPARAGEVANRLPEHGVTAFLPTVVTAPPDVTQRAISELHHLRATSPGARSLGVHLEGPFINPARAGAHAREHIRPPNRSEAAGWSLAAGIAVVTLAPEMEGALDLVADLVARGVVVCCGHSDATAPVVGQAIAAGASGATHMFNAMGPLSARSPGLAGAIMADDTMMAGIIADGLHVDPVMVALAWRALGAGRLLLVTDSMAALGMSAEDTPPGQYQVGDTDVTVGARGARATGDVLAGSLLSMDDAVRNLMAFTGCSIAAASAAASATPARLLGRRDVGRLAPGTYADAVLLDSAHHVVATVVGGRVVHDPERRLAN